MSIFFGWDGTIIPSLFSYLQRVPQHLRTPQAGAVRASQPPFTKLVTDSELAQLQSVTHTLETAIAQTSQAISQQADQLRSQVLVDSTEVERASWPTKTKEAAAYLEAGGTDDSVAPLLKLEAVTAGIALHDLVATVNAKANVFYALEAQISGTRRKHLDAIAGLNDIDSVLNYDWSGGWPDLT